jgi:6-phosphofructokinase 2
VTVTLNPALDLTAEVAELVPYRKLRGRLVALDPGGGGVNVARVLRRFDVATQAILPVGGTSGRALLADLQREGVAVHPVAVDADTRRSVTLWVSSTREHFRIQVEGEALPEPAWRACLDAIGNAGAPAFVALGGSLPPGVPPTVVVELAERARELGARFVCDTSGAGLAAALDARADLIKPSRRELRDLVAPEVALEDFDHREAARRAVALGARAVVVSLGADGAFLAAEDGAEAEFPSPSVDVLSSVGAGDSMVAGILLGLLGGRALPEAVQLGVAAGAATCMQHGTEVGTRADVERLDAQLAHRARSPSPPREAVRRADRSHDGERQDDQGPTHPGRL